MPTLDNGEFMNRLKCCIFFLSLLSLALGTRSASASGIKGASLAIYNNGQALVQETRSVNLPQGMASIVFKDVPATMDPTSVHALADDVSVLDVQYSYLPITSTNLLKRFVGKEVTLILPDPVDANARIQRTATLLSVAERPIFQVEGEVYMGNVEGVRFPELPADLQEEPSLTLTADSATAGKRDVLLGYLMGGLTWRADYNLALDDSGKSGDLSAWATIGNSSGRGFVGADLKLVAGDVNREPAARKLMMRAASADMAMESAPAAPTQESFSQFHVYTVDRPVNIAEAGTRQIGLFSSPKVSVTEELVSTYRGMGQMRGEIKQPVAVNLLLSNTEAGGLGKPMPAGLVRVFRPTADGSRILAGETSIPHVGNGGDITLPLGNAFDVSVERTQTAYSKTGKNSFEMTWRIAVTNGSAAAKRVVLRDMYSGQWEVIQSDREHTLPDSGTLEYALEVPPNAGGRPVVVTYSVRVIY